MFSSVFKLTLASLLSLIALSYSHAQDRTQEGMFYVRGVDSIRFIAHNKSFHKLIDTTQQAMLLYDKGVWLEGPQVLPNGDVIVSDVKQNMLLIFHGLDAIANLNTKEPVSTQHSPSSTLASSSTKDNLNATSQDSTDAQDGTDTSPLALRLSMLTPSHFQNGHALDNEGHILAASHGKRGIERFEHNKWKLITDSYEGKKLNSPNDLIIDSKGNVWFSDPLFGLQNPLEGYGGQAMQGGEYIYYLALHSKAHAPKSTTQHLIRLHTPSLHSPNGLALSPDEKLLYVADSARAHNMNDKKLPSQILVYTINADKTLSKERVFAQIEEGIPDGIKVDAKGNVWSSSAKGVIIFNPKGQKIGEIIFPELVGNLTFSLNLAQKKALQKHGVSDIERVNEKGDKLFITSGGKFYMLNVLVESGIKSK